MRVRIRDAELSEMSPEQREDALARLVAGTRGIPNGELREVREEIADLEAEYGLASDDLLAEVEAGHLSESYEVCRWLMLLNRRARLERRLESSQTRP